VIFGQRTLLQRCSPLLLRPVARPLWVEEASRPLISAWEEGPPTVFFPLVGGGREELDGEGELDLVCNLLERARPGESPIAAVKHGGGRQGELPFLCR
jgi:hypothetical protein